MRSSALISFRAPFGNCEFAELRCVLVIVSPFVLDRVKVVAALMIVWCIFPGTLKSLKINQVQVPYLHQLPSPVVSLRHYFEDVLLRIIGGWGLKLIFCLVIRFIL